MQLTDQEIYLKAIYGDAQGSVCSLQLFNDKRVDPIWGSYKAEKIIEKKISGEHQFLSVNTFNNGYRKSTNVKFFTACFVDLDIYQMSNVRKENVIRDLYAYDFGVRVPPPTMIINSGHGMYLMWKLVPESGKSLDLWNEVQKVLVERLHKYGSDPKSKDAARVLRVPNTYNSKYGEMREVSIIEYNPETVYTLDALADRFRIKSENIKKKGRTYKVRKRDKKNFTAKRFVINNSLFKPNGKGESGRYKKIAANRVKDIETVVRLKGGDIEGFREVLLWHYRNQCLQSGMSCEQALDRTRELNSRFLKPLKESEVIKRTSSCEKTSYLISTETLIDELYIDIEIQKQLICLINDENIEKCRRTHKNKCGMSRDERTSLQMAKAQRYLRNDMSMTQVAKELGVSRAAFYKMIRKYSEAFTNALRSAKTKMAQFLIEAYSRIAVIQKRMKEKYVLTKRLWVQEDAEFFLNYFFNREDPYFSHIPPKPGDYTERVIEYEYEYELVEEFDTEEEYDEWLKAKLLNLEYVNF